MDLTRKSLPLISGLTCLCLGTLLGATYSEDLKTAFQNLERTEETAPAFLGESPAPERGFFESLNPSRLFEDSLTAPPLKNSINQAFVFDRDGILDDHQDRIAEDFHIPDGLHDRVGFWFDVYTKYDSDKRVIHHALHPWIIFEVVDVSSIINSDTPSRRWMRNEKADKYVRGEVAKIKTALQRLSRRGVKPSTPTEIMVAEALKPLPGSLSSQARKALGEVRVQMGQKEHFVSGLRMSQRYMTHMEEIIRNHKLPVELARIPFVESSFNKQATSKVGASGIWQFMTGTGKKFMRVDELIDERRSPLKATEGAARLLKENHMILHRSWPLAITAWNHGPPGVRRAIKATGTKDLSMIVGKYRSRSFDFASSNFYSEFLAALHAEKYSAEIFGSLIREPEINIQIVTLKKRTAISKLIEATGLSREEFFRLNPDLSRTLQRRGYVPAGYKLHAPTISKEAVENLVAGRSTVAQVTKPATEP